MLLLVVYTIKTQSEFLCCMSCSQPLENIWVEIVKMHLCFCVCIVTTILYSWGCLWLSRFLSEEIISGGITDVEPANNSYLPSYLGYFFVALSISDGHTLLWIFIMIFMFTFNSQTLYFNPIFLVFNYKFYYITVESGMKLFVITKRNIKTTKNLSFPSLKRINNYTFIER